jgi:hypothetical protein
MNVASTSAMTVRAFRAAVGEYQTLCPKLHQPSSSGGDTFTRNTSGFV